MPSFFASFERATTQPSLLLSGSRDSPLIHYIPNKEMGEKVHNRVSKFAL